MLSVTFLLIGSWYLVGTIRLNSRIGRYVKQRYVQTLISELARLKGTENRERCIGALATILQIPNLPSDRFDLGIQYLYGCLNKPHSTERWAVKDAIYLIAHSRIIGKFESSVSAIASSADEVESRETRICESLPIGDITIMQTHRLVRDMLLEKHYPKCKRFSMTW